MRVRLLALTLALAGGIATPAAAMEPTDARDAAVAHFGGQTPACGVPQVKLEALPAPDLGRVLSIDGVPECVIYVDPGRIAQGRNPRYAGYVFCAVVVHEYGHLLGLGHSENPLDVMAASYADASVPACERLMPPLPPPPSEPCWARFTDAVEHAWDSGFRRLALARYRRARAQAVRRGAARRHRATCRVGARSI